MLRKLLILVVSLLGALALAELAARKILGKPVYLQSPPHLEVEFRPDPAIMPGIEGTSQFLTNSMGLRARELAPGQGLRILTIGGSTTACDYLDQTEAWPALLESLLAKDLGEDAVWVGNAGASGLRSCDHLLQFDRLAPQIPDLDWIICLVGVNDVSLALQKGPAYRTQTPAESLQNPSALRRVFAEYPQEYSWLRRRETALWRLFERKRQVRWRAEGALEDRLGRNYIDRRRWRAEAQPHRTVVPDLTAPVGG